MVRIEQKAGNVNSLVNQSRVERKRVPRLFRERSLATRLAGAGGGLP